MALMDPFMPSIYKEQGANDPSMGLVVPGHSSHKRRSESTKPVESHRLFVAIFVNDEGVLKTRCSAPMRRHEQHVLEEAYYKFKDVAENFLEQPASKRHPGMHHPGIPMFPTDMNPQAFMRKSSKRRFPDSISCLEHPILLSSHRKGSLRQSRQPMRGDRIISLRVDDKEAQAKWFSDAFKAVQQVVCRTIAKQSTHPYNGLYPRNSQADPSRTKPPYWPAHVKHKEPDHIDRNARTALLVHLIMNTPQHQIKNSPDGETLIYAQDLLMALEEKKADFKGDRWQIIVQIVDVRTQIENYEMGGFDPDTVIFVPDFSESSRSSKSEAEDDPDASMAEGESGQGEEDVNDNLTTAQTPTPGQAEEMRANNDFCSDQLGSDRQSRAETIEVDDQALHQPINMAEQASFVHGHKADDVPMQVQRHHPLPEIIEFHHAPGLREGVNSISDGWLHPPSSTPGFMPPPPTFGLNGGQMLVTDGFPMNEISPDQPMLDMSLSHSLPTADGVAFQGLANTGLRPIPAQAMSTGYANVDRAAVGGTREWPIRLAALHAAGAVWVEMEWQEGSAAAVVVVVREAEPQHEVDREEALRSQRQVKQPAAAAATEASTTATAAASTTAALAKTPSTAMRGGLLRQRGKSQVQRSDASKKHDGTRKEYSQQSAAKLEDRGKEGFELLKEQRKSERAQGIADGLLHDPSKKRTLETAITPVGTCEDMCPAFERAERVQRHEVDRCEKIQPLDGGPAVPSAERMVKKFVRSDAGREEQLPSDIRTPEALVRTMDHLIEDVVGKEDRLIACHNFVWDRTRAVRNDFSIQQVSAEAAVRMAVDCHERSARFLIVSLHILSDEAQLRPGDHFDAQQDVEQLNKTFTSLWHYYDAHRGAIHFPNEAEFRSYQILFEILSATPDLEDRMHLWPYDVLADARVQTALQLYQVANDTLRYRGPLRPFTPDMVAQMNACAFWDLLASPSCSYLMACVAEMSFHLVRFGFLTVLWRSVKSAPKAQQERMKEWTVSEMRDFLSFDADAQVENFCAALGLEFHGTNDKGEHYLEFARGHAAALVLELDNVPTKQVFSYSLVEAKRLHRSYVALINGMTAVQAIEAYEVVEEGDGRAQHQHQQQTQSEQPDDDDEHSMTFGSLQPPEPKPISAPAKAPEPAFGSGSSPAPKPPTAEPSAPSNSSKPFVFGGSGGSSSQLSPTTSFFGSGSAVAAANTAPVASAISSTLNNNPLLKGTQSSSTGFAVNNSAASSSQSALQTPTFDFKPASTALSAPAPTTSLSQKDAVAPPVKDLASQMEDFVRSIDAAIPHTKDLVPLAARLAFTQPNGLLHEYLEYTLEKLLPSIVEQHQAEVFAQAVARLKEKTLARKWFPIWRRLAYESRLNRPEKAKVEQEAEAARLRQERAQAIEKARKGKRLVVSDNLLPPVDPFEDDPLRNHKLSRSNRGPTLPPRYHKRARSTGASLHPPPRPSQPPPAPSFMASLFSTGNSSIMKLRRSMSLRESQRPRPAAKPQHMDNTRTDFFRLLAHNIDPETPLIPLTQAQVDAKAKREKEIRAARISAIETRKMLAEGSEWFKEQISALSKEDAEQEARSLRSTNSTSQNSLRVSINGVDYVPAAAPCRSISRTEQLIRSFGLDKTLDKPKPKYGIDSLPPKASQHPDARSNDDLSSTPATQTSGSTGPGATKEDAIDLGDSD
ncbi:hypothetical protein DV738_g1150, partial [Chaetothyriales sp. CBS 135597]